MKNIKFTPLEGYEDFLDPKPAIECLPDWYKKSSNFFGHKNSSFTLYNKQESNLSYKKCVPYLDALSSGYYLFLNSDIVVDQTGQSEFEIIWKSTHNLILEHNPAQVSEMKFNKDEYSKYIYKFICPFQIKTPPGYSCLFVHPLNRMDLPFTTMSGIVDTDSYDLSINFPFLLKKYFNGIIEHGTPIVQIIPFKRENWKMNIKNNIFNQQKILNIYNRYAFNAYRKLSWQRKYYR